MYLVTYNLNNLSISTMVILAKLRDCNRRLYYSSQMIPVHNETNLPGYFYPSSYYKVNNSGAGIGLGNRYMQGEALFLLFLCSMCVSLCVCGFFYPTRSGLKRKKKEKKAETTEPLTLKV